ncbi:hypothetical protein C8J57DRAFT_1240475 [Mycena rebaudengoi]|nr:hypothetical protein C8J57DRAFT_1240475 [Mycena rebaudengoi]
MPVPPLRCLKGCLEPLQPRRAGEPFIKPTRAIKWEARCLSSGLPQLGWVPSSKVWDVLQMCMYFFVNRPVQTKGTAHMAARTGMAAVSLHVHAKTHHVSIAQNLPTTPKQQRNTQAERLARDLDRSKPIQTAVHPAPPSFFSSTSFEERKLKEKAEEAARSRSWQILSDIAKMNLRKDVEPVHFPWRSLAC